MILFIILVNVSLLLFNEIVALKKVVFPRNEIIYRSPSSAVKNFNLLEYKISFGARNKNGKQ